MSSIAIIDLDSICFTIAHPNKVIIDNIPQRDDKGRFLYIDKTDDEMLSAADDIMHSILKQSKSTGYIAYIKGKGNYRYAINPEYKANRPKESPKWWSLVKNKLIDDWGATEVNGIEVDDAVRITNKQIPNSFICAIDNDLLYLEGINYNWRTNKWITVTKQEANYKFWSDMIAGQPGDNVKGIPGSGIKAAERVLNQSTSFKDTNYTHIILQSYIEYFGENKGIQEFYKNYQSLHILEHYEGLVIPEIIEYKKNVEEIF